MTMQAESFFSSPFYSFTIKTFRDSAGEDKADLIAYWPMNVFSDEDAAAQLSVLRAIASSDLHNWVYSADYRIIPAVTTNRATSLVDGFRAI
jgi:hypothetical protein